MSIPTADLKPLCKIKKKCTPWYPPSAWAVVHIVVVTDFPKKKKKKKLDIFLTSKLSKTGASGYERQNEWQNRKGVTVLGGNGGLPGLLFEGLQWIIPMIKLFVYFDWLYSIVKIWLGITFLPRHKIHINVLNLNCLESNYALDMMIQYTFMT